MTTVAAGTDKIVLGADFGNGPITGKEAKIVAPAGGRDVAVKASEPKLPDLIAPFTFANRHTRLPVDVRVKIAELVIRHDKELRAAYKKFNFEKITLLGVRQHEEEIHHLKQLGFDPDKDRAAFIEASTYASRVDLPLSKQRDSTIRDIRMMAASLGAKMPASLDRLYPGLDDALRAFEAKRVNERKVIVMPLLEGKTSSVKLEGIIDSHVHENWIAYKELLAKHGVQPGDKAAIDVHRRKLRNIEMAKFILNLAVEVLKNPLAAFKKLVSVYQGMVADGREKDIGLAVQAPFIESVLGFLPKFKADTDENLALAA